MMMARITIIVALLLFFVPSFLLLSLSYISGSSDPQYLRFMLEIPFMGTYPCYGDGQGFGLGFHGSGR